MRDEAVNNIEGKDKLSTYLEGLNQEETERLLEGIDSVTLEPNQQEALQRRVLQRIGVSAAEKHDVKNRQIRRIRPRKLFLVAAVLVTCTVVAVAAVGMDGLQRFWGADEGLYEELARDTFQSVENQDMRLNIEAIAADRYQCILIVSTEALSGEGEKLLADIEKGIGGRGKPEAQIVFERNGEPMYEYGTLQYTEDNQRKEYKAYQCHFPLEGLALDKPVTIKLMGLSMSFAIPEQVEMYTLYADSQEELGPVELSQIGYSYCAADFSESLELIKKDGTVDKEMGYWGGITDQDQAENRRIIGYFNKMIDLNQYAGIRIDGVDYRISETQQ